MRSLETRYAWKVETIVRSDNGDHVLDRWLVNIGTKTLGFIRPTVQGSYIAYAGEPGQGAVRVGKHSSLSAAVRNVQRSLELTGELESMEDLS